MATDREYLHFIMEMLPEGASYRAMMGEYVVYYNGKVIGGIYDNRFLVKITPSSENLCVGFTREIPYEGAKPMILVENAEDRDFLQKLLTAMFDELSYPKRRNKK